MRELSIITGVLDRPEPFRRLYESILRHTTDVDWELVVSDASEFAPLTADAYPPNVRILKESPRRGHAAGYNMAFREAQGKYVIWLNDDVEVKAHWARRSVDFLKRHPEVGMGAIYYGVYTEPFVVNSYQELLYANFGVLERTLGDSVGWFDEDIVRMYGADNSLAFKVWLSGRPVVPVPGAVVVHRMHYDEHRRINEQGQAWDASRLMDRYRDRLPEMWKVRDEWKERVAALV